MSKKRPADGKLVDGATALVVSPSEMGLSLFFTAQDYSTGKAENYSRFFRYPIMSRMFESMMENDDLEDEWMFGKYKFFLVECLKLWGAEIGRDFVSGGELKTPRSFGVDRVLFYAHEDFKEKAASLLELNYKEVWWIESNLNGISLRVLQQRDEPEKGNQWDMEETAIDLFDLSDYFKLLESGRVTPFMSEYKSKEVLRNQLANFYLHPTRDVDFFDVGRSILTGLFLRVNERAGKKTFGTNLPNSAGEYGVPLVLFTGEWLRFLPGNDFLLAAIDGLQLGGCFVAYLDSNNSIGLRLELASDGNFTFPIDSWASEGLLVLGNGGKMEDLGENAYFTVGEESVVVKEGGLLSRKISGKTVRVSSSYIDGDEGYVSFPGGFSHFIVDHRYVPVVYGPTYEENEDIAGWLRELKGVNEK